MTLMFESRFIGSGSAHEVSNAMKGRVLGATCSAEEYHARYLSHLALGYSN